ncbi:MAG: hypothetical protein ACK4KT_02230 [Thermaurantimonas sp.]
MIQHNVALSSDPFLLRKHQPETIFCTGILYDRCASMSSPQPGTKKVCKLNGFHTTGLNEPQ